MTRRYGCEHEWLLGCPCRPCDGPASASVGSSSLATPVE